MWTTAVTLCFWLSAQLLPSVNLYQNQAVADFHLKLFFRWTVIKVQANPLKAFFCVFSIFPVLHVVPVTVGQTALLKALLCPSCCCLLMTMFPVVVQSTSWSQRHWADVSCWEASLLPKSEMRSLTALRTAASGAGFGFFIIVMKKYQQHLWATIWTLIIFKKFNLWSTNSLKRFIFTSQINSFCVCVCVCRPVQCSGRGQECWCVDTEGQEVTGTRTSGSAPHCEKHQNTHVWHHRSHDAGSLEISCKPSSLLLTSRLILVLEMYDGNNYNCVENKWTYNSTDRPK